jgi:hypothetical protein
MIKTCVVLHVKYPLLLSDFNATSMCLDILSKNTQIPNITKIHLSSRVVPSGKTDGRTDGQRDVTNLIVASRNFANAPYKELISYRNL